MFVAYTGHGRIATLGEEVRDPRQVIPRAIIVTMAVVAVLYVGVATAGVGVLGADAFGAAAERSAAPLEAVARALDVTLLTQLLAVAAMAGVLLDPVPGLSRVLLIAAIALTGNVRTTWSFSAFTVLVYYAITHLAALRLPEAHRLYPRWIPFAGLVGCLGLAFWVEREVWMVGLALLAIGLAGHWLHHRRSATHPHT